MSSQRDFENGLRESYHVSALLHPVALPQRSLQDGQQVCTRDRSQTDAGTSGHAGPQSKRLPEVNDMGGYSPLQEEPLVDHNRPRSRSASCLKMRSRGPYADTSRFSLCLLLTAQCLCLLLTAQCLLLTVCVGSPC